MTPIEIIVSVCPGKMDVVYMKLNIPSPKYYKSGNCKADDLLWTSFFTREGEGQEYCEQMFRPTRVQVREEIETNYCPEHRKE